MQNDVANNMEEMFVPIKEYIKNEDSLELIKKAYLYAQSMHEGQLRKSGEPYMIHAIQVGYNLAKLHAGPSTISAGLLHDVLEDCSVTKDEMTEIFGEEITMLVEAVTKIGNIKFKDEKEYQAANHRKIFIAMAKDIRVILIKLVDRLHNMRTLQFQSPEKQVKIAKETLAIYASIAHRLGLSEIKNELEDLSFFYIHKDEYYRIAKLVENKKNERDLQVTNMLDHISKTLKAQNIEFRIFGRSKHLYSIYKKMTTKNKRFEEILDLLAIRIVTKTELNCYEILGHIHSEYRPIPGRLKDYIAMPKMNMYQSLHTTIVGDDGRIFEVQIRTEFMDDIADNGIAAHWAYKESRKYDQNKEQKEIESKLSWFKDFVNVDAEASYDDPKGYMEAVTTDIFDANVYVMTPLGRIIDLPQGACPIDFAYRVHTEVGHCTVGAIVNEILVPLNTPLKTGDVVKIKTSKQSTGPSEDWLKFVKTQHAKNKIKNVIMKKETERKAEFVSKGEQILKEELRKRGFNEADYLDKNKIESVVAQFRLSTYVDLLYAIAVKSVSVVNFVEKLTNQKKSVNLDNESIEKIYNREMPTKNSSKTGIKVEGVETMMLSLAQCCLPIHGDEIIGYITKGSGVKVHRVDCPNIINEKKRLIEVKWDDISEKHHYFAHLLMLSSDRNFLLTDIVTVTSQNKAMLQNISSDVNNETLTVTTKMIVQVDNFEHLRVLIANLKKIESVINVNRIIQ